MSHMPLYALVAWGDTDPEREREQQIMSHIQNLRDYHQGIQTMESCLRWCAQANMRRHCVDMSSAAFDELVARIP